MQRDNAKEHVKLYKSKKNWVAATIFTTALGVVGVSASSSANADNINPSSVNSNSSSKVASSSVKPSNTVTLRSSSVAKSSIQAPVVLNQAVKSSSTQSSNVASKKASLQSQINQKKQVLSNEQSQQSNLQRQYQQDSQTAQQASQTKAAQISQIDREASSKKQVARNTMDNIQKNEINSQKSSLQNQIKNAQGSLNNVQSQINSVQSSLQNKQNELSNLQNGNATYNDNEGVVENVAHMDHDSHDYKKMFGPLYVTPDNNKGAIDENNPLLKKLQIGFSYDLRKHDLISNNHPTQAQYKEICEALMAELNATREARGLQPFVMTDKMFNAVMERASQPSAQGENSNHNSDDIDKALKDNGINPADIVAECLSEYANLISPMKDVADLIYSKTYIDIYDMLNDDADCQWGHRAILLDNFDQPVQASFGLCWVPEDGDYNLVFDVAKYNGDGSDDLMNQVKSWENQPVNDNESQIKTLKNDISNLQNNLNGLNAQKQSLENKINDLNSQMDNVKFNENQLSSSSKQAYNDAQNTLNTVNQWQQSQIKRINNSSNVDVLNKKTNNDKAALDKLNQQIAQTKQEINDLENQLNALDGTKTSANKPSNNPSKNLNGQSDKQVQNSTSSTLTPAGTSTVTTTTTSLKNNDVLPGPDSIVEAPQETSEPKSVVANHEYGSGIDPLTGKALKDETPAQQQKAKAYVESLNKDANSSASSTSNVANRVVANISYKKGIDPLTDHLLSDETPAQRQKAKAYIDHLNNNAQGQKRRLEIVNQFNLHLSKMK